MNINQLIINQQQPTMKTATIELPAILVSTINAFEFPGNPLWRVGQGLDHVKIELTYKLPTNQPISVEQKEKPVMSNPKRGKAKRRTEPAPSAGEWPRQSLPATQPPPTPAKPTRQQPQRRCKTPRRELPTTPPTSPAPLRQCPPPATPTIVKEPTTILRPILKNANRPPPSPMIQPPPPADEPLAIYEPLPNPEIYDLTYLPDLSDLPGGQEEYETLQFPIHWTVRTHFEIAAFRHFISLHLSLPTHRR